MARKRKVGNLMGLAVLATLAVRPMHRYEIAATMKERGKDRDMAVKWGSLYTVVENLEKHGFLEVVGSERDGARPERVIYRITDAGRAEMLDWAKELLSTPEPEPSRFVAGLSVMAVLTPDDAVELLDRRLSVLEAETATARAELATLDGTLPRLFLVEMEYTIAMRQAETEWVRALRDSMADGSFPDLDQWRCFHDSGRPAEYVEEIEARMKGASPSRPTTD
ncbi:PadR family transcriptional regulator [Nocardia sp. NPDC050406]|uniref:PadR family transcriptional regulator n=1 Tax=Nocardia sp. NPDC050406 TaxID=3364318 RepID=UPI0037B4B3EC